jgi:alcohol dehydrogenase
VGTRELHSYDLTLDQKPVAHFGVGAISKLGEIAKQLGAKRALIVTDAFIAKTEMTANIRTVLMSSGLEVSVFDGVTPNPTTACVDAGSDFAAHARADLLIALGGGSSMDTAKGVSLGAKNPERGVDLDYTTKFKHDGIPIIAIPTTAGTGSEVNAFGVITDESTHVRFYVGHSSALAKAAILDPELTIGLPPKSTAATGMDALVHAVESFISKRSNPYSDGISFQTVEMVSSHLERAYADGSDIEARSQMLLASHIVGVGFSHTGLGLVHGIGHSLGGHFNIPHGVALCLVLEEVLRFNAPAATDRLAKLSFALGVGRTDLDDRANCELAIQAIARLTKSVGLGGKLSDFGITDSDLELLATTAIEDAVTLNNPIEPKFEDVMKILRRTL